MASVWDIEGAVEELKKLRAEGMSCSRIADAITVKFNWNVTRNAIIGKLSRLGVPPMGGRNNERYSRKQKRLILPGNVSRQRSRQAPLSKVRQALNMPIEPLPERRADDIARISFDELENHHCHFIPGSPDEGDALYGKKYCGLPVAAEGLRYCREHLERCHSNPTTPNPGRAAYGKAHGWKNMHPKMTTDSHLFKVDSRELEIAE